MNNFEPRDNNFKRRVEESFNKQNAMKSLGITLEKLKPGRIELRMPYDTQYTQQHGFVHAGILSTAMDSACGYAAFSLMPENAAVLSIEFKTNLLAPAKGEYFEITGEVLKAGRTITVCQSKMFSVQDENRKLVAQMTATMMTVLGREGIQG